MLILKLRFATPPPLHHLFSLKKVFISISTLILILIPAPLLISKQARIELNLRASDGVDEGEDEAEECRDEEGDIDDECETEAFGVVGLDDV